MSHAPGMNTYHGKAKDRQNWHRSIKKRNKLVEELKSLGIKIDRPHEMRIDDLKILINNHRKTVEANKPRRGKYLTYSEIARQAGMTPQTLIHRMQTGLTLEQALLKPVQKKKPKIKLTAEQIAIAESNGITRKMLSSRILELDWTVEDAITLPKGTRRASMKVHQAEEEVEEELNMTKEERRALRRMKQAKRLELLDKLNELETNGASQKEINLLERELENI